MNSLRSLYIHFPFCRHLCNFCDFYKKPWGLRDEDQDGSLLSFHQSLQTTWDSLQHYFKHEDLKPRSLKTLYIGGGTPSLWSEEGILFLKQFFLERSITMAPKYEWTLEVDPYQWDKKLLKKWLAAGVNRFSVGIQSMDEEILHRLDRKQEKQEQLALLEFCYEQSINYSVDFILGAPESGNNPADKRFPSSQDQRKRNIAAELDHVLMYGPKHVSLYFLSVNQTYPLHKFLPSDDSMGDEYNEAVNFLQSRGFDQYEVSNFSIPGYESQHNWSYWRQEPVLALGPSASGLLYHPLHKNWSRYRVKANNYLPEWDPLRDQERKLETLYLSLRTTLGVDLKELFDHFGLKMTPLEEEKWKAIKQSWDQEGFIGSMRGRTVILSSKGKLCLDGLVHQILQAFPGFFRASF